MLLALLLSACGADSTASDCVATVDEDVRTRLHVTWDAPEGGTSWVEFAPEGREGLVAPAPETSGERHAVLVGAGPLEDVSWTAITEIDGRRWTCEGTTGTGNAPSGLPTLDVTVWDAAASSPERFVLGALQHPEGSLVFLADREGRLVWWEEIEPGRAIVDVEPLGGPNIAWNAFDGNFAADLSELRFASVLGGEVTTIRTPLAHHTFTVVPDGFAWLALDVRDWTDPDTGELRRVAGDAIVVGAPGEEPRTVWSSWDAFVVEAYPGWDQPPFYEGMVDWTHGNALRWEADRGAYLYSTSDLSTIGLVDPGTGEMVESYGHHGAYAIEAPGQFIDQHDPSFTADGHLLVSTRTMPEDVTHAAEFEIDHTTRSIRQVWESGVDHGYTAMWLGQASRLANGNTLVGYGSEGVLQEITPDHQVVWELRLSLGATIGMVELVDDPQEMAP
jgi:hypothetical protein